MRLKPFLVAVDEFGVLPSQVHASLRRTELMSALTPEAYGGAQAHPRDFFAGVVELSAALPALGWVAGVLGVHSFEIALTDSRLRADVWRDGADAWIASPFAQDGKARRVEGGYRLTGAWEFSSGFKDAKWLCIGGVIEGRDVAEGGRNFCLPRDEASELPGTWDVVGLRGTGSLSFSIEDVFVPEYRVYNPTAAIAGTAGRNLGYSNPLYFMPRQTMLSTAITASTLGAGLGLVRSVVEYTETRLKGSSKREAVRDPHILRAIAEAEADIECSITQMLTDVTLFYDTVKSGDVVRRSERMRVKRNLVRSVHRCGTSLNEIFTLSGGGALRLDRAPQAYWRDFNAGRNHNSHIYDWYTRYGADLFGYPSQGGVV